MNKTTFATRKDFHNSPEPPAHVHDATCWQSNDPLCVKWRVGQLEQENRELFAEKHHLLGKLAAMQNGLKVVKSELDKMYNSLERELRK